MPRARKTMSGQAGQAARPVTGQQYGKGVEQRQLQQAMPAPKGGTPATQIASTAAQAALQQQRQPQQTAPQQQTPDLMALAAQMRDATGILTKGTDRPNEPVTTGLASGPGAGPEILGTTMRSPLGDTLRMLSRVSGDAFFSQLADKARL